MHYDRTRFSSLLLLVLSLLFSASASANLFSVLIDTDQNPASGCRVTLDDGSTVGGIEYRILAGVNTASPPVVSRVNLARCDGGALGPAQALPAGIPVGLNIGLDGSDVVEFSTTLRSLGLKPGDTIDTTVVGTDPRGGTTLIALPGIKLGEQPAPVPIPTLSVVSFMLLALVLLGLGWRYLPRGGAVTAAVVVLGVGMMLAYAANFAADGRIDDWAGVAPVATNPPGNGSSPVSDIRQVFVAEERGSLFFRLDITELEGGLPPLRVQVSGPDSGVEGQTVSLHAIALHDLGAPTFGWRQTGGPSVSLSSLNTADTSFIAPAVTSPTVLRFEATATDSRGTASRVLEVLIQPDGIFVDAGKDRGVAPGNTVTLHANGQGSGGASNYSWTQISPDAPQPTLSGANTSNPSFVAPNVTLPTTLVFEVTFSDGLKSTSDRVEIDVFQPSQPANAGSPLTVLGAIQQTPLTVIAPPGAQVSDGTTQKLVALANGGDGNYSWFWKFKGSAPTSAPKPTLGASNGPVLNVTLPAVTGQTTYAFTVEVTDGNGQLFSDSTSLFVAPSPTTAPLDIVAPSLSASEGPIPVSISARAQGGTGPYQYQWTQTGGPSVTLANADSAMAHFQPPAVDADTALTFEVTVTDNTGASVSKAMNVLVRNAFALTPPQVLRVQSLPPVEVLGGKSVPLAVGVTGGTAPYSWSWQQTSGPSATLSGQTTDTLRVQTPTVTMVRTLEFEVTVTDSQNQSATGTVQIDLRATPSTLPLSVTRIPTQYVDEGQTDVAIPAIAQGGTGSYSYSWRFIPGAGVQDLTLRDADTAILRFDAPQVSAKTPLRFDLTITDGVSVLTEDVYVIVNDLTPPLELNLANPNPLTVHSGDQVALTPGIARGGESPYTYGWTQKAGPTVTLTGSDTPNPGFIAPSVTQSTSLVFQMTVTDAVGNRQTITESITVEPAIAPLKARLSGPQSADSGTALSLNTQVSGGVPPYSYSYTTRGPQIAVAATANPTLTLPDVATDTGVTFTLQVHDSATPPNTATDKQAVTIIAPLPPLEVTLIASDAGAAEQGLDPGAFTVTASRAAPVGGLTVNLGTAGGTATAGSDYTALPGSVTIPAGQTSAMVTVTPIADSATEGDETVTLALATGSGYAIGTPNNATVTISDAPVPVTATVTAPVSKTTEGESGDKVGKIVFSVTRASTTPIRFNFTVGGSATLGTDYKLVALANIVGSVNNNSVQMVANATQATIGIQALTDNETDPDETVTLTLQPGSGYTVGSPNTGTVTIENKEPRHLKGSQCLTCGNLDQKVPCTDLDLVLGGTHACPDSQPYCMNDIIKIGDQVLEFRRCIDELSCDNLWYQSTSDNPLCLNFDPAASSGDLACHLCCYGDGCNFDTIPPRDTLYRP